jgi:hypothetical protein
MLADLERARHPASSLSRLSRRGRGRGGQNIFEQINNSTGAVQYLHHDQAVMCVLAGAAGLAFGGNTVDDYSVRC